MKKIFAIVCIVLILAFSSLTCFANNSDVLEQVEEIYPFFDLNWEAISLNHRANTNISQATIDDIALYSIDNVFSADVTPMNADTKYNTITVCDNYGTWVVNQDEYVFSYDKSVVFSSRYVQGVSGGQLSIRSDVVNYYSSGLRCGSVFNLFKSPNLKLADFYDQMDMDKYNDYVSFSFIVPIPLYENIKAGTSEQYYDFTWHFSADVANADTEEVFFTSETYDVSFGKLFDSGNVSLSRSFNYNGTDPDSILTGVGSSLPSGFMLMTVDLPLGDFLYNISYNHSLDTGDSFYGCFYRNLEFYPTFDINPNYLAGVLSQTAEIYGDTPYIQQYFDLVGTGLYFPVVDKTRCLPIYSVYSHMDNLDYDIQSETLDFFNDYFYDVTYEIVSLDDFNLVSWLGDTVGSLFDIELLPNVSISTLLYVAIGIGFLFVVLKMFAGG